MIVLRLLLVVFVLALVASLLAGLLTGQRKYYTYVKRILVTGALLALCIVALVVIERFVLR